MRTYEVLNWMEVNLTDWMMWTGPALQPSGPSSLKMSWPAGSWVKWNVTDLFTNGWWTGLSVVNQLLAVCPHLYWNRFYYRMTFGLQQQVVALTSLHHFTETQTRRTVFTRWPFQLCCLTLEAQRHICIRLVWIPHGTSVHPEVAPTRQKAPVGQLQVFSEVVEIKLLWYYFIWPNYSAVILFV